MRNSFESTQGCRSAILGLACCLVAQAVPLGAQVRALHTRDATRLSQVQVMDQLKRSDVIFIPLGSVETNGIMPSDRDYVSGLAYAMAMAEETGGLYMPGLVHSFPGTTVIGSSTVYMSPSQGLAFAKTVARSLLRQGFRRQVWLSSGHGPAPLTGGTLVREFFEETHVPILYIEMGDHLSKLNIRRDAISKAVFGAHLMTGRIEDLPVQGDYGDKESHAAGAVPENDGLATLGKLHYSGSLTLGSWIPDVMAHGGSRDLPANAAEREQWGKDGVAQIKAVVKQMRLGEAMDALKKHDEFTQKMIVPKFREKLPTWDSF
jgi:creatinine amidohydrolase